MQLSLADCRRWGRDFAPTPSEEVRESVDICVLYLPLYQNSQQAATGWRVEQDVARKEAKFVLIFKQGNWCSHRGYMTAKLVSENSCAFGASALLQGYWAIAWPCFAWAFMFYNVAPPREECREICVDNATTWREQYKDFHTVFVSSCVFLPLGLLQSSCIVSQPG